MRGREGGAPTLVALVAAVLLASFAVRAGRPSDSGFAAAFAVGGAVAAAALAIRRPARAAVTASVSAGTPPGSRDGWDFHAITRTRVAGAWRC